MKKKILILIILLQLLHVSCSKHNNLDKNVLLHRSGKESLKIEIIDSILIYEKVSGFDEFIPISVSPSKNKFIIAKKRGGKVLFICDLDTKSYKKFDFNKVKNSQQYPKGINNAGFFNNDIIVITYRNELYMINTTTNKILSKYILPEGYYSSYCKKIISLITEKDTLFISQLYSPNASKYDSEADGFYDLSPISIYSLQRKKFLSVYLPKSTLFRKMNLGQPVVNFTKKENKIFFKVSPENKIYSFRINTKEFKLSPLTSYTFSYLPKQKIKSETKSNKMKDLTLLTSMNPTLGEIVLFKDYLLLNYSEGLNYDEYENYYNPNFSEKERVEYYYNKKRAFINKIDLEKQIIYKPIALPKNVESIAINISDSLFILKPRVMLHKSKGYTPIYIAKINNSYE